MLIRRFYDTRLAQASFLIGCQATGEALVLDPARDVEPYLGAAEAERMRIVGVAETHIHADFVSGARELAARTGARAYLSDEGDADWKYAWAAEAGATLLHDGDAITVGNLRLDVMHTPGHTPEHLCFVLTDTPATSRPVAVFTGDFVFAGDLGRPDLLEKAAGVAGTMEAGARTLYRSVQRFKRLPDYLQLWPGHGAGSACGKALGAAESTTLGYERIVNWGLADIDEDAFVARVLDGQPEPPRYFATMKRINKAGPALLHGRARAERLPDERLASLAASGALVVDTRPWEQYAAGHLGGALHLPLDRSFTTWAGWLLPYDRDLYLLVDEAREGARDDAMRALTSIGLDRVAGWIGASALAGLPLVRTASVAPREAWPGIARDELAVLDVRNTSEFDAGHLPGATHVPLGDLAQRLAEVPAGRPLVVQCQGGARSAIATSVLEAHGVTDVVNLTGGYAAWLRDGLPVERGALTPAR